MGVIGKARCEPYGSPPMLSLDPTSSSKKTSAPIHLDVETRVRNWTVTRVLEPSTPGMQEAVAEDAQGVPVVLRVPGDTEAIERVFAEAAMAKRHRHWGIVHTIGVVDHQGWPVQVIEHVDGLTLDAMGLLAGSLAPEAVCRIGWQVAMILVELHREPGGYHGAISGERIIVDAAGHVRLADLGRARPEQLFRLLSPERRASGGVGSPEDDLYALGGTLIEAALGRPLERTIGWIDTRALGGVLPERLIDALDALVAPSGKRLKNAAAVMRVFETVEPTLGDGASRLKKAVEYARLGAAIGSTPPRSTNDDERRAAPAPLAPAVPFKPFDDGADAYALTDPGVPAPVAPFVPFSSAPPQSDVSSALDGPTEDALPPTEPPGHPLAAATAPAALDEEHEALDEPDEPTIPGAAAVDLRAAAFFAHPSMEPVAPRPEPTPDADEVVTARETPSKKKWPLFSRMIAWGFVSLLVVNVLAALWVLAEPPLSRALGTPLPKLPYSDLSFDEMVQSAFLSMASSAAASDVGAPALDEDALAKALLAAAAEAPAMPPAADDAPTLDFGAAPSGGGALSEKEQAEFAAALAALAAELEKAQPGLQASAPGEAANAGLDEAPAALAEPAAVPYDGARPVGMPKRKAPKKPAAVAAPAPPPPEKVVDKPAKSAKVEKPAKAAKVAEAAPAGRSVKLIIEAPSAQRAAAEAGLRACNLDETVNGVVRVSPAGTVRSVSTDPLNACVAKVLKSTLGGFEEDAPFEARPH